MEPLSNARRERYCQERAAGKTQEDAYVCAGYSPRGARASACRLEKRADVAGRIASLLAAKASIDAQSIEKAIEATGITKGLVLKSLLENARAAFEAGVWSASNRAWELIGKELGMFIDTKKILTGPLDMVTTEELQQLRDALNGSIGDRTEPDAAGNTARITH